MKLLIIIPSYNEAESLKDVIEGLKRVCPDYDYIIINDGSTDSTEDLCARNGYNVINLPENAGLAEAVRTGMKYALKNGYDAALQFDADGQHLPEYIDGMVKCMAETDCDIVIGSRFLNSKMPLRMRTVGGKMISRAVRYAVKAELSDPTSGMRLFGSNIMSIFVEDKRLTPEPDTIAYLIRMGAEVREVKVRMEDRMTGQSYLTPINAAKYMARMMSSILFKQKKWDNIEIPRKTPEVAAKNRGR